MATIDLNSINFYRPAPPRGKPVFRWPRDWQNARGQPEVIIIDDALNAGGNSRLDQETRDQGDEFSFAPAEDASMPPGVHELLLPPTQEPNDGMTTSNKGALAATMLEPVIIEGSCTAELNAPFAAAASSLVKSPAEQGEDSHRSYFSQSRSVTQSDKAAGSSQKRDTTAIECPNAVTRAASGEPTNVCPTAESIRRPPDVPGSTRHDRLPQPTTQKTDGNGYATRRQNHIRRSKVKSSHRPRVCRCSPASSLKNAPCGNEANSKSKQGAESVSRNRANKRQVDTARDGEDDASASIVDPFSEPDSDDSSSGEFFTEVHWDERCSTPKTNKRRHAQTATAPEHHEYEISSILGEKGKRRKGGSGTQLLVRWKPTWVDEADVNAPELLEKFRLDRTSSRRAISK